MSTTGPLVKKFIDELSVKFDDIKKEIQVFPISFEENFVKYKGSITKYDKGVVSWQYSSEIIQKQIPYWFGSGDLMSILHKKSEVLKSLIKKILEEFDVSKSEAEGEIRNLVYHILMEENSDSLQEDRKTQLLAEFLNILNKIPPNWSIRLWVHGIWLEDINIKCGEEIAIRRPQNADYSYTEKLLDPIGTRKDRPGCGAIIELKLKGKTQSEVELFISKFTWILRLFRKGSIEFTNREYSTNSYIQPNGMLHPSRHQELKAHMFKYEISQDLGKSLKEFIDHYLDKLPSRNWQDSPQSNLTHLFIAVERYMEAITGKFTKEHLITSTITCLEALLLKSNERSELSHKLSQRVALLLGLFEFNTILVYAKLKRAYDVRSIFIHGSFLPKEEKKDLNDLHNLVTEYARICILCSFEMTGSKSKDDFIKSVDNAIISSKAQEKLAKKIDEIRVLKLIK